MNRIRQQRMAEALMAWPKHLDIDKGKYMDNRCLTGARTALDFMAQELLDDLAEREGAAETGEEHT